MQNVITQSVVFYKQNGDINYLHVSQGAASFGGGFAGSVDSVALIFALAGRQSFLRNFSIPEVSGRQCFPRVCKEYREPQRYDRDAQFHWATAVVINFACDCHRRTVLNALSAIHCQKANAIIRSKRIDWMVQTHHITAFTLFTFLLTEFFYFLKVNTIDVTQIVLHTECNWKNLFFLLITLRF